MRLSSLLLLSLLPLSVARALPPTDTSNDDSGIADQTTLFFGKDDRTAVTNSSQWPWQAIGQVETASGNLCTATLISPRLALTAGHCVLAPPGKIDRAVALRFISHNGHWKYQITSLETLVDAKLGKKLKPDGDGWIVPPAAAAYDYALIRLTNKKPVPIKPLPLWDGTANELTQALKQVDRKITQAGYPLDHLDTLYSHEDCLITGWAQQGVLSHQCDTLPGDSGSPLLLKNGEKWSLIAIQSSAPAAKDRYLADNRALAVTAIKDRLKTLANKATKTSK
ncbi:protease [Yersinia enterocolitica]|uniref:trypsin-like serine peptidase n=1 Tax=Yersinia enterocolitica TaxID=630 RepID=UPI0002819536|nr:serine protease [Yersinia enterocolitica]AJI84744.1 trypsin family protein [Yersinia enterocolitica]EKA27848.1 protease [Yersinia enterocolitica subsp. enterocolitica WA-314]ELI8282718.1 serine protease [Yersinia enterocolitica]KGA75713.1 trypsin family protein [Yersinia enterocolitica]MCE3126479.1 serine protease [Yersinia enterocolitica]